MTFVLRILVLILLLSFTNGLLQAQDTTCDSGDIIWVKETVNADEGVVGGGTTAEYNNFATPFGIQAAFDEACAGAIIRIVTGVNHYGPSSTSWNNRDATDKQINVDIVDADTSASTHIFIQGWVDETTQCGTSGNRWTASCPVMLNFDRDNITGADGFNHGALGDGYHYHWIGVEEVDADGFDASSGENITFNYVAVLNTTAVGIRHGNSNSHTMFSFFQDVGTGGSASAILGSSQFYRVIGNVIECSTTTPASGQNGITQTGAGSTISENVIRNCNVGISTDVDHITIIRNTVRIATDDCIFIDGSSPDFAVVTHNLLGACAGDAIQMDPDAARTENAVAYNIYDPTGSQLNINAGSLLKLDADDARNGNGADFTTLGCEFADTDDETLNAACAIPLTPPGAQLPSQGSITPGAIYEAGAGGASMMIQGVR